MKRISMASWTAALSAAHEYVHSEESRVGEPKCHHITPLSTGLYLAPSARTGQHLVRVYDCVRCGERVHDDTAPGAPHLYVACRENRAPCEGEPWNPPFDELRHLQATQSKVFPNARNE